MSITSSTTISEAQLQQMALEIHQEIPEAEVHLFGSHARGEARLSSDVDLMIIVTDAWYAQHNWIETLGSLWRIGRGGFAMAAAEAKTLLRVALRDLQTAQLLEAAPAPESRWGFHIQQAIEKALKAWILARRRG